MNGGNAAEPESFLRMICPMTAGYTSFLFFLFSKSSRIIDSVRKGITLVKG